MSIVITNLIGGLGNQLFQFAHGLAFSAKRSAQLKVNTADFCGYGLHNGFELLRIFSNTAPVATSNEVQELLGWKARSSVRRALSALSIPARISHPLVVERNFRFDASLDRLPAPTYLHGYWQSYKYFQDQRDLIAKALVFSCPLSAESQLTLRHIGSGRSAAVHVRRGDYVANSRTAALHGSLGQDYYSKAMRMLRQRHNVRTFFVFSDDPEWCRQNLLSSRAGELIFVDHNKGVQSYEDLRLMSACDHNVIANSTFSWWGAWMNRHPEKTVVAPNRWFAASNIDTRDLVPTDWVRL